MADASDRSPARGVTEINRTTYLMTALRARCRHAPLNVGRAPVPTRGAWTNSQLRSRLIPGRPSAYCLLPSIDERHVECVANLNAVRFDGNTATSVYTLLTQPNPVRG